MGSVYKEDTKNKYALLHLLATKVKVYRVQHDIYLVFFLYILIGKEARPFC